MFNQKNKKLRHVCKSRFIEIKIDSDSDNIDDDLKTTEINSEDFTNGSAFSTNTSDDGVDRVNKKHHKITSTNIANLIKNSRNHLQKDKETTSPISIDQSIPTQNIIELVLQNKKKNIPYLLKKKLKRSKRLLKPKKIKIKLAFTLYTVSPINCYSQTAIVNFELVFIYRKWDYMRYKFVPKLDDERHFPFVIINSCGDMSIIRKSTGAFIGNNVIISELYGKTKPIRHNTRARDTMLYETYNIICEVKVINRLNLIPFNALYVPINIGTNGLPGTENINFINSEHTSFCAIMRDLDATFFSIPHWERFSNTYVRMTKVVNNIQRNTNLLKDKSISKNKELIIKQKKDEIFCPRAYFLIKYNFNPTEELIKYFIIPTMFNNMLIMFSSLDKSDYLALFTTLCLTDIALLFTMPETKCVTLSEASIISDVLISILLTFKRWFYDSKIPNSWHWIPSVSKGVLLLGGKIWSYCKFKNETSYLNTWFTN